MKLLNNFLLTLMCAATISSCSAMTPEQQARVNEQLGHSAERGDLPGVQQALAAGADIHIGNDLPLQLAARCGRLPVVQFLVQHGADIHANNDLALQTATIWRQWAVVVYLLQQGAEREVLSVYELDSLYRYIHFTVQTALGHNLWHWVEELLSAVPVHELPQDVQQKIRAFLVPAVLRKLNSACLVLPITPIALRTLSFIVGPKAAAAFIYFIKEDTHEIAQEDEWPFISFLVTPLK